VAVISAHQPECLALASPDLDCGRLPLPHEHVDADDSPTIRNVAVDAAGGSVGGDRAQAGRGTDADGADHNLPVTRGVGRERPSSYAVVTRLQAEQIRRPGGEPPGHGDETGQH
jgi:hypothetical protein